MAYFPDLTPCTYFDPDFPPLTAVGWLDAAHPFPIGDPGLNVFQRLQQLRQGRWRVIYWLGYHTCDLCRYDPILGSRDIFIPGDGVTYVAPEGIIHYIGCHGYLPPEEFCEAVRRCPPPDTPEFFTAFHANGWAENLAGPDMLREPGIRQFACEIALNARGRAICAAAEAAFTLAGNYPETLQAVADVMKDATWTYAQAEGEATLSEGNGGSKDPVSCSTARRIGTQRTSEFRAAEMVRCEGRMRVCSVEKMTNTKGCDFSIIWERKLWNPCRLSPSHQPVTPSVSATSTKSPFCSFSKNQPPASWRRV